MTVTLYPATSDGVAAALAALGSTATEVANVLCRGGHRGHRGSACDCPVATYLQAVLPDVSAVMVDASEVWAWLPAGIELRAVTPDPVFAFMEAFDSGHRYQDLAEG